MNWQETRQQVLERDNYTCQYCHKPKPNDSYHDLNTHHIIPRSKGGSNNLDNLITYCHKCHRIIEPSKGPIVKGIVRATFNVNDMSVWGLKQLALDKRTTTTELVNEALRDILVKYGQEITEGKK